MNVNFTYSGLCRVLFFFLLYVGAQPLCHAQASQYIIFDPLAERVYGTTFNLTATASSGLAVRYTSSNTGIATITGSQLTVTGVGIVTITAYQDGNASYAAASPESVQLTTKKANQTINFPLNLTLDKFVDDPDFTLAATASSGLPVTFSSTMTAIADVNGNTVHLKSNGTTTIIARQDGNENYYAANEYRDIRVHKRDQTINFAGTATKYMGDADFDPGATVSSGLPLTYISSNTTVATIVAGKVHVRAPGNTNITATHAGNTIYNPASKTQVLTVSYRDQTITFDAPPTKTFGDANFTLNATASSGLAITYTISDQSVAKIINGNTVQIVAPGSTSITAAQDGGGIYKYTSVIQPLEVLKKTQSVTFAPLGDKLMGDADFTLAATASSGLDVTYTSGNPWVATIVDGNKVHLEGPGTAIITASQAGNYIYGAAEQTREFTVTRRPQTITFNALPTKKVGDPKFTLTATASSGLDVGFYSSNADVATTVGNELHIMGAGTAIITATQEGTNIYDAAQSVEQILTVQAVGGQPIAQSITFAELSPVVLGHGPLTLSAVATSGLPVSYVSSNAGVASVSGNVVTLVAAGQTQITALQGGNAVYAVATPVTRTLKVLSTVVGTEHESKGVVSIYPNPVTDRVTIAASRFTQQAPVQVILVDAYGRVVAQEALRANNDQEVDLSIASLHGGVYILSVKQGAFEFRDRIVKIR
jgi:hypothetical protein